jgi:hypothetical protein
VSEVVFSVLKYPRRFDEARRVHQVVIEREEVALQFFHGRPSGYHQRLSIDFVDVRVVHSVGGAIS